MSIASSARIAGLAPSSANKLIDIELNKNDSMYQSKRIHTRTLSKQLYKDKDRRKKLTPAMIDWLTDESVLLKQVGLTLAERAVMLHRQFG